MNPDTYEAIYREAAGLIDEPENFKDNPEYVRALCDLLYRVSAHLESNLFVNPCDVLARLKRDKGEL